MTMTVAEFEEAVWKLNRIRIVIRLPANAQLHDYDYRHAANRKTTYADFVRTNLDGWVAPAHVVAIDGSGNQVADGAVLQDIRDSYKSD